MSSKVGLSGLGFPFVMAAGIVAVSPFGVSSPSLAQMAPAGGTTSIESEKARGIVKEPSFQTREERLNAMPLDWNSTIGSRTPTAEERKALEGAGQGSSAGGAPNPQAKEEAQKLHPDDWK